jgi:UDP-N-acetylglucosamine 4,6-dehydratase/5-epimerase
MTSLRERRVLVTGGTGSFGNFIVHRLLDLGVREVRVLSRDEKKQYDMRVFYGSRQDLSLVIGDIRDARVVDEVMAGIEVVIQAAALKQVPTCERFPMEAVKTNIEGARNVAEAALRHDVQAVVAISTDKAVKPVNVMGMTKAIQERIFLRANESPAAARTRFAVVRYGNVLRSRGSVVPFFRSQLAQGRRLTITDTRMTRFLLTLDNAIDLVLFAAEVASGGEVFVRKAPSARVVDIAQVLSDDAGVELDYELIGVLPGEKIDEILVSEEELGRTEDLGDYYRIHPPGGETFDVLGAEYSSAQTLVDLDRIRELIAESDREFEKMEMRGGEFAKF